MSELLFLLLPVAAASGWWLARREHGAPRSSRAACPSFLRGLNYLLDEQPDKAIDLFLELTEVNGDTVETHLALGTLFRRRGEVDRAIRIHQNLIERRNLAPEPRSDALLELGQDYMRAGLLDRAEALFQELADSGVHRQRALLSLRDIYQQERDWHQCLTVAECLRALPEPGDRASLHVEIAHYHCELAEEARRQGDMEEARRHVAQALEVDPRCARATLIEGQAALAEGEAARAVELLLHVADQCDAYLPEMLPTLIKALHSCGECVAHEVLSGLLEQHPSSALLLELSRVIEEREGSPATQELLIDYLARFADAVVLERFLELEVRHRADPRTGVVLEVVRQIAARHCVYHCEHCGFQARSLHWQCPSCKCWGSVIPTRPEPILVDETPSGPRLA